MSFDHYEKSGKVLESDFGERTMNFKHLNFEIIPNRKIHKTPQRNIINQKRIIPLLKRRQTDASRNF